MRKTPKLYVLGLFLPVLLVAQAALADAAADLKQAEELYEAGQYEQAEQAYQNVLNKADPETPEERELAFKARTKLPVLYLATDRQPHAQAAVQQLLAKHADHEFLAHALHEIVEQAKGLNKTLQVRRAYQTILTTQPQHSQRLWLKMGVAVANVYLGDDQAVDATLKDIIARHGGDQWAAEALAQTGWAYDKLKDYAKARPLYEYVVDNWPDKPRAVYAHTALVRNCIRLKDKEAARVRLEQLVQRYGKDKDLPNVLTQIGRGYREARMYEQAAQVSQYVLDHHPSSGFCIWAQRDIVLSDIGQHNLQAAEAGLQRLVERYGEDGHLPYVLNEIAGGYRQARMYGHAKAVSQQVLDSYPESEHCLWAQRDVVLSHLDLGDAEAAGAGTQTLLTRFAKQSGAIWAVSEVAEAYSRLGQHQRARDLFTFNLQNCPDLDDNIWSLRGSIKESIALNDDTSIDAGIKKLFSAYATSKNLPMAAIHIGRELLRASHARAPELFQYVHDKHPDHGQAIFAQVCMGHVHVRRGEDSQAEAIYRKVLTDHAGDPRLPEAVQLMGVGYYERALAEEARLRREKGEQYHEQWRTAGPAEPARQYFQKALLKWKMVIERFPEAKQETPAAYQYAAITHSYLRDYDNAAPCFEKVAYSYPDYEGAKDALLRLARTLRRMALAGRLPEEEAARLARPHYERLLERYPGSREAEVAARALQLD